jgi:hypothetical protein
MILPDYLLLLYHGPMIGWSLLLHGPVPLWLLRYRPFPHVRNRLIYVPLLPLPVACNARALLSHV